MKIIRGELTPSALIPPSTRYDATCDCIQVTTDGGTTWHEAVGQDPRHQPAYLIPPVAGSSKQCDAAANMVKWLHDFMDEIIAALAAGAQAIFAANTFISFLERLFPFAAYFIELVFEAAVDLFGRGSTALDTAFDSTTYALLLCIFYCHADADGRVSAANLTLIEADIVAQLSATAAAVVNEILFIQGEVGLSNAGAIGGETGDCTSCACLWCHQWNFKLEDGSAYWTPDATYGTWVLGSGWVSDANGLILRTHIAPTTIRDITFTGNNFGGGGNFIGFNLSGVRQLTVSCPGGLPYECPFAVDVLCDEIILNPNAAGVGNGYIFTCLIRGEGTSPFGDDNC